MGEDDWDSRDLDFYIVHEIGKFGRTVSRKRYRIQKVKQVTKADWFW